MSTQRGGNEVGYEKIGCESELEVDGKRYKYFSLSEAQKKGVGDLHNLPKSLKVLCENLLRHEDGISVVRADIEAFSQWKESKCSSREISFYPSRVLMQDFTGVPAIVDLAVMREAVQKLGGDPKKVNPLTPVHLVIDHSVNVDHWGSPQSFDENMSLEMSRNQERYEFLKWGQEALNNFQVVPPGTGICHQVNLEALAQVVTSQNGNLFPDTLVGTDSHTTMVNGLSVLGWGVGGIEAEAAMLGQPVSMILPEVIGVRFTGDLPVGVSATDLVLTVVHILRKQGVVGKFVEFFGEGLKALSLADRATLANMAPEYGATCGFFPVDEETLVYLKLTGRSEQQVALVEKYAKAQGLWADADPIFTDIVEIDLCDIEPSVAGPKRPQDLIAIPRVSFEFQIALSELSGVHALQEQRKAEDHHSGVSVGGESYCLSHGDIVIAAITSCTNTSNPYLLIAAGLLARNARKFGIKAKPWVKTSFAPGSQVVSDYLSAVGLQEDLDFVGFNLVGYGCTTCIGNSGPLNESISKSIDQGQLVVCSVLSGNRNFEGRIHHQVRANYLASPPYVVAYALAGSMKVELTKDPLGMDSDGNPIYLRDLWPKDEEVRTMLKEALRREMFERRYSEMFKGPKAWQNLKVEGGLTFKWNHSSTYVKSPPYFEGMKRETSAMTDIHGAKILALLGDSVTTDHISPAGSIKVDSPAGSYLQQHGVEIKDFNSYGARRGNHEVMMRGTYANIRLRNYLLDGIEGGYSRHFQSEQNEPIYDVAMKYQAEGVPLLVMAGKEYGTGSSRDWAAKGTALLGIRAVVAESFERIHRSNLIGMGILPLEFPEGQSWKSLKVGLSDAFDIVGLAKAKPGGDVRLRITRVNGAVEEMPLKIRIDTAVEFEYYRHGGILPYMIRQMIQ